MICRTAQLNTFIPFNYLVQSTSNQIDSGHSIFTLAIKNRPYMPSYQIKTKEPYSSLAAEIKNSVSFPFLNFYLCMQCYSTYLLSKMLRFMKQAPYIHSIKSIDIFSLRNVISLLILIQFLNCELFRS